MICCTNCFKDIEVKAIIEAQNKKGTCDVCKSKDVFIYDTSINTELEDMFNGLLDIYMTKDNLPASFPRERLNLLKNELNVKWQIFNINEDTIYKLITKICAEKYKENPDIFDSPVGILESTQEPYLESFSLTKTYHWEDFVKSIKIESRFHTPYINVNVLNIFCSYVKKHYKKGDVFYRARISDSGGLEKSEMGAPPKGQALAGRANPAGISYLYLSNKDDITLHEVRAGAFDYVTIGKFVLLQDITVVNLAEIDKISPFYEEIDFTQHAINKEHLKKISEEIAKPLRRQDSVLDYLPTQYVSDYIKSIGYDGIEFKSTMRDDGYNVAIFDERLFECESISVVEVKELRYIYK